MKTFRRNALKRAIQNIVKKHINSVNSFIGNKGINHFPILVEELTDCFYQRLFRRSRCPMPRMRQYKISSCGKFPDVFSPHRKHKQIGTEEEYKNGK